MNTDKVIARTSRMWADLGKRLADSIPDLVIAGEPLKAIHMAVCAEACFWKSTGEDDSHGIKDVLPIASRVPNV